MAPAIRPVHGSERSVSWNHLREPGAPVTSGSPNAVVQALNREMLRALAQPDVQEKNRTFDYVPTGLDPRQSAAWLKDNRERWAQVIKRAGIMVE